MAIALPAALDESDDQQEHRDDDHETKPGAFHAEEGWRPQEVQRHLPNQMCMLFEEGAASQVLAPAMPIST